MFLNIIRFLCSVIFHLLFIIGVIMSWVYIDPSCFITAICVWLIAIFIAIFININDFIDWICYIPNEQAEQAERLELLRAAFGINDGITESENLENKTIKDNLKLKEYKFQNDKNAIVKKSAIRSSFRMPCPDCKKIFVFNNVPQETFKVVCPNCKRPLLIS